MCCRLRGASHCPWFFSRHRWARLLYWWGIWSFLSHWVLNVLLSTITHTEVCIASMNKIDGVVLSAVRSSRIDHSHSARSPRYLMPLVCCLFRREGHRAAKFFRRSTCSSSLNMFSCPFLLQPMLKELVFRYGARYLCNSTIRKMYPLDDLSWPSMCFAIRSAIRGHVLLLVFEPSVNQEKAYRVTITQWNLRFSSSGKISLELDVLSMISFPLCFDPHHCPTSLFVIWVTHILICICMNARSPLLL